MPGNVLQNTGLVKAVNESSASPMRCVLLAVCVWWAVGVEALGANSTNASSFVVLSSGLCEDRVGQFTIHDPWGCMEAGKELGFIAPTPPVSRDNKGFYECQAYTGGVKYQCSQYLTTVNTLATGCLHLAQAAVNSNKAITTNLEPAATGTCGSSSTDGPMDCVCFRGPLCNDTSGTKNNSNTCMCGKTVCTEASGRYCTAAGTVAQQLVDQCTRVPLCASRDGRDRNNGPCACGSTKHVVRSIFPKLDHYVPLVCTEDTGMYCFANQHKCSKEPVVYTWRSSGRCNDENNAGYMLSFKDCNNAAEVVQFQDKFASRVNSGDFPPGCYRQSASTLNFNYMSYGSDCGSLICLCATASPCQIQDGNTSNSYSPYCMCGRSLCSENTGRHCANSVCSKVPPCQTTDASKAVDTNCQCGGIRNSLECSAGKFCYVDEHGAGECNDKQVTYSYIQSGHCESTPGATFVSSFADCQTIAKNDKNWAQVRSEVSDDRPQGCHTRRYYTNLYFNSKQSGIPASSSYVTYCANYLFDCEHGNGTAQNERGCKCGSSVCEQQHQYCLQSESRCSSTGPIYPTTTTAFQTSTALETTTAAQTTTAAETTTAFQTTTAAETTTAAQTTTKTTTMAQTTTPRVPETTTTTSGGIQTSTMTATTTTTTINPSNKRHQADDFPVVDGGTDPDEKSVLPIAFGVSFGILIVISLSWYWWKKKRDKREVHLELLKNMETRTRNSWMDI